MNGFTPVFFLGAGIVLTVLEMVSLTFYLAALAFASLFTALVTWVYPLDGWQAALVFAVGAAVALPLAHVLRRRLQQPHADTVLDTDKGSRVTVTQADNAGVKVRYRDSSWEAVWEGGGRPEVGQPAEVVARDGSRLRIKPVG